MKKILSFLGTITLIGTSTTSLVSCQNDNNKYKYYYDEKEQPTPTLTKPLENSRWSLVNKNEYKNEFNKKINKWYVIVYFSKYKNENIFAIDKEKISFAGVTEDNFIAVGGGLYVNQVIYRWNGDNEPEKPTINKNTGEIIDWKEHIGT
ncbi:lipoprotein [Spiroplasma endosymbiont of Polydrusus cervinus]|uniref:lipoprotein n=1 Tax=Spiroplasma endosymbiont of Polydrusus cervinus TaxID=3066287 RepID=UPI0030D233C3